jgi:hypothetical protein
VSSEKSPRDVTGGTQGLVGKSEEKLLFGDDPVEPGVMGDDIEATGDGLLYLVWLWFSHGPPMGETGESSDALSNVADMDAIC